MEQSVRNIILHYLNISSDADDSTIKDLINKIDKYEQLPIHLAARDGRIDVIKAIVQLGGDVDTREDESQMKKLNLLREQQGLPKYLYGKTALYIAAERGDEDMVEYLLSSGADPNIYIQYGTPINAAAKAGHLAVIKLLVQAGADIDARVHGYMAALHEAAARGDEDMVEYLLSKHADTEVQEEFGDTAIHTAAKSRKLGVIKLLLQGGAYIYALNYDYDLALQIAANRKYDDMVEYLFSKHLEAEGINLQQKGQKEEREYLEAIHIIRELLLGKHDAKFKTFTESRKKDKVSKLIHFAAKCGRFDVVKALLRLGADVNSRNNEGKTVLHIAAHEGLEDIGQFLLSKHADVYIRDNRGDGPIHLATIQGRLNFTKTLLESGVDPNVRGSSGLTPLHIAVRRNNENMVDLLLSKNADPGVKTKWNATPLHFAIYRASQTIAIKLLDSGAKVGENSTKILILAIEKGYLYVVKYLILHCGCIGGKDENDLTPLHVAVLSKNKVAIKLLLKHGVKTTLKKNGVSFLDTSSTIEITNVEGVTGVHNLTSLHLASNNGQTEKVEMLISYGASVNITDDRNYTSLHYATENGHTNIVKILTSAGAAKDAVDTNGTTPLHLACRKGLLDIVRLLISKPSASLDIKDRYRGYTPLHEAIWNGFSETVKLLLKAGADKETMDKNGQTALSIASGVGHLEIVKILIKAGADLYQQDINGLQPVDIVVREGFHEILDLLQKENLIFSPYLYKGGYYFIHSSVEKNYNHIKRIATEYDKLETTRILLKLKFDVNAHNVHNLITPLHIASRDGFPKIVELLLLYGAFIEAVDKKGWIPLQYAAVGGHNDVVLTILNFKADKVIGEGYLESSLLLSSREGHYEVVKTFLEFLVDPDTIDETNRTALHYTCIGGYKEIVRLLLRSFGSTTLEAKDKWGWSALNYAASWRGHEETVAVLLNIKHEKQNSNFDS